MPKQEKADSHGQARRTEQEDVEPAAKTSAPSPSELDADVDALLDEIDEVLEVNAEDFVKSFVQKGGQ